MEQRKNDRVNFWRDGGAVEEEVNEYLGKIADIRSDGITLTYEFFTLLCC